MECNMDYSYLINNESNNYDQNLMINALNGIDNTDHYELTDFKNEVNDLEDNLKLIFLIDNSFSMTKFIEGVKKYIKQIIKDATIYLNDKKLPEDFLRISLILYNDQILDSEEKK